MFWNNYSVVNPANSGFFYRHFATVQSRWQWIDFEKNPKTTWINYDIKIDRLKSGSGIYYAYDEIGNIEEHVFTVNYNIQFAIREVHRFALGACFGYQKQDIADNWVATDNFTIDGAIPGGSTTSLYNTGIGIIYHYKKITSGFSVKNLTEPAYRHEGTHWDFDYPRYRTYYFLLRYKFELNESLELEPGLLIRHDITAWAMDVNVRTIYKEKFWLATATRVNSGNLSVIGFMLGVSFWNRLQLGYNAEFSTGNYRRSPWNTHEAFISFALE